MEKRKKITGTVGGRAVGKRRANLHYKDTVFRMLFQDKKRLLGLYNAVGGRSYKEPEKLDIAMLESAVYLGMKNDLAFIVDMRLYLFEHQSTINQNKAEVKHMSIFEYNEEDVRRAIREEAYEDGKIDGKIEIILYLLEEKGTVPAELERRLRLEKDENTLRGLLKLAGGAETIEEFCGKAAEWIP